MKYKVNLLHALIFAADIKLRDYYEKWNRRPNTVYCPIAFKVHNLISLLGMDVKYRIDKKDIEVAYEEVL